MQRQRFVSLFLFGLLAAAPVLSAQTSPQATTDQVIDKVAQTEAELIERMRTMRPIVEAYIQETSPEVDGVQMPMSDSYFLGRFEWREGPVLALMADTGRVGKSAGERRGFIPDGFAAMAAPDWKPMDRTRYNFKFARKEFLGEVRTMVFDVTPKSGAAAVHVRGHEEQAHQRLPRRWVASTSPARAAGR